MSYTNQRKKPSKKNRAPETNTDQSTQSTSIPKKTENKQNHNLLDPRQRLRDKIKAMQKDRAKGSYACEENANHEY